MADQKPAAQQATTPAAPPPAQRVEDIPDPDEDDLDDLDDVLDEFSATKLDDSKPPAQAPTPPAQQPSGPAQPPPPAAATSADDEDAEFAKQLQAGMAELLSELGQAPDMAQQLETLVKELGQTTQTPSGGGSDTPAAAATPAPTTSGAAGEDGFQDQIRRTMERMQASGEQASAAAASSSSSSPDDILAQMLAEMEKGGFGGEGGGGAGGESDEDFSKMLMSMMEQLTNKEILYEPMKELHDKLPGWLAKNREATGKEDLERYEEQQRCVSAIVERFERPGYSDESAADREFIVDKMQKMQAAGSPPPDLVGDMSSAQEALGELDQGCATQ